MKKFVIGDIHGNYKALLQCLMLAKFNYQEDKLIVLGDTCDGLPDVKKCFDELLKIKNLIHILGNHDDWALEWFDNPIGIPKNIWTSQGGLNTLKSYDGAMTDSHLKLLKNAPLFHIEYDYDDSYLFVHGGINPNQHNIHKQDKSVLLWDRELIKSARWKNNQRPDYRYGNFERIYVGHTTTECYCQNVPIKLCNIFMLDTGAGWSGNLTIMNIESGEFWQSEYVEELYPHYQGR